MSTVAAQTAVRHLAGKLAAANLELAIALGDLAHRDEMIAERDRLIADLSRALKLAELARRRRGRRLRRATMTHVS